MHQNMFTICENSETVDKKNFFVHFKWGRINRRQTAYEKQKQKELKNLNVIFGAEFLLVANLFYFCLFYWFI